MESAFGIEHGDISKGMSPNKAAAFARENSKAGRLTRKGNFAGHKLNAKRWGAEKAKTGNPTGYYIDGPTSGRLGRDQLSDLNGTKKNRRLP